MFLNNAWYVAAWDTEVGVDTLLARQLLGLKVVLYRGDDGIVAALEDRCCHRWAPLSQGQREGNCIRCMYHGLMFDASGKCVEIPGQDRISERMAVRSFPVAEKDHLIWIWMGDPSLADASQIHNASFHNAGQQDWWPTRGGYIHYKAAAELIADNLLDFSHLAFVHNRTIGTRAQAEVRPEVERLENAVRINYVTRGGPTPPFAREVGRLPETTDRFQNYTWHVKGFFFAQDSVIAPPGDGRDTTNPFAIRLRTIIAVTPETDASAHYFWSSTRNDFNPDVPDITGKVVAQVARAFQEDREIIEAQQQVITQNPGAAMLGIAADAALQQARRMLDALVAKQ